MDVMKSREFNAVESFIQSLKEMMLMRSGKLPKRSWDEFAAEMRKEIADDDNE